MPSFAWTRTDLFTVDDLAHRTSKAIVSAGQMREPLGTRVFELHRNQLVQLQELVTRLIPLRHGKAENELWPALDPLAELVKSALPGEQTCWEPYLAHLPDGLAGRYLQAAQKFRDLLNAWEKHRREREAKSQRVQRSVGGGASKSAKALASLIDHQDWTDTQIADHVGVNRTSLYRMEAFMVLRRFLKKGKGDQLRGQKTANGDLEAWDAEQPTR